MRNRIFGQVTLTGDDFSAGAAGTSAKILIYLKDAADDILWASGTDVPADGTAGYAAGCMFIDRDVAAGTVKNYLNVGTAAAANFDLITVA